MEYDIAVSTVRSELLRAVQKRTISDKPIGALLSGGLDSSLVVAILSKSIPNLKTFSIGLADSEDLKYAAIVAKHFRTNHHQITITEKHYQDAIPLVISAIESADVTTVRASVGNWLLGKYIKANTNIKVVLNGDGSDELLGGYLYMDKCPDDIEFDKETRRLLKDIHLFDVLRSDKSISSNGLEPRTPFLDRTFVNYILSIPPYFRNHTNLNQPEKYLLRKSFSKIYFVNYNGNQILPTEILWRKKEAFSDGVSSKGRSLFTILQELIASKYNNKREPSIELEKMYYKEIFDKEFPNCSHILPYFWMPKYTNATDPSARTLEVYNKTIY
jgi:asparagine synthase (glutamine-hydrolysing)